MYYISTLQNDVNNSLLSAGMLPDLISLNLKLEDQTKTSPKLFLSLSVLLLSACLARLKAVVEPQCIPGLRDL